MKQSKILFRLLYNQKIWFLILLCFSVWGKAQEGEDAPTPLPTVFSPSPNVAQMNKYLDQPVNYSTGIPEINIPLYTISVGDIQVPISLSYHASGIKVNQESSSVGLGWSLSAGGVVSREIRGIIDDYLSDSNSNYGGVIFSPTTLIDMAIISNDPDDPRNNVIANLQVDNQIDLETDLFNLVFPGGGSQFVFDQEDRKFYELNRTNSKIKYTYNLDSHRIYQWEVTNEKGIKYHFGGESINDLMYLEKNKLDIRFDNTFPTIKERPEGVVAWYLNNIQDSKRNRIDFKYQTNDGVEYYNKIQNLTDKGFPNFSQSLYSISTVNEKVIEEITFPVGKVKFKYSENTREDLKNSRSLNKIEIYNNTTSNVPFKTIEFRYSYFSHILTNGTPGLRNLSYSKSRLKLDSVIIRGMPQDSKPLKYAFEYDETLLPQKYSYAQDYWGGFNGKLDNMSLLPAATFINSESSQPFFDSNLKNGAERHVDQDFVKAGTLIKIKYPTGGYTIYDYEPNTASIFQNIAGLISHNSFLHNKNIRNPYNLYTHEFFSGSNTYPSNCNKNISLYEVNFICPFTIESALQGPILVNESNSSFNCPEGSVSTPTDGLPPINEVVCNFRTPYVKKASSPISYTSRLDNGSWMFIDPDLDSDNKNLELIIPFNGTVEIFDHDYGEGPQDRANFNVLIDVKEDVDPNNKYVGGLRVKSIENFDRNDQLISSHYYEYEFEDETNYKLSSGLTVLPQFALYSSIPFNPTPIPGPLKYIYYLSDVNFNPLASYDKTYYEKVLERNHDIKLFPLEVYQSKEYNFKNTTFKFSEKNFVRAENELIKKSQLMNASWDNKLEFSILRDTNNNIIKADTLNYYRNSESSDKIIFSGHRLFDVSFSKGNVPFSGNLVIDYNTYSGYSNVATQKSVEYLNNNTIENFTRNRYENVNPLLISSQETTNSLGDTLKTEYQYPQDLPNKPQAEKLISANRISEPLVVKSYNNGNLVSQQETVYGDFTGLTLPKFVYAKKGTYPEERKITYDDYDDKGNLLQYTLENGIPISIIWGYNGQYPIAKVEGVRYIDIHSLAQNLIDLSNSGSLDETSFNTLRNTENVMVTGYVYKPLIGVTSIIQPNGQIEYYEYDNAGRLEYIKDHNGKVIKRMEYHYKN